MATSEAEDLLRAEAAAAVIGAIKDHLAEVRRLAGVGASLGVELRLVREEIAQLRDRVICLDDAVCRVAEELFERGRQGQAQDAEAGVAPGEEGPWIA